MKKIFASKYFTLVFIPISFLFTLIYSWTTSPLYLGNDVDSSIFQTIGLGIAQGKLPYVDLFDHKGGLFFIIQSLGWHFGCGRWGMLIIQTIFMYATLTLLFKTAELILDRAKAFGATICTLLLYIIFMESGNQCETYMLPFTALTLYLALKYLIIPENGPHPLANSFIYGLCFAIVFWIRPNDAVSQIGAIMAGIFFYLLYRKEYLNAIVNACIFLAGCAAATAPLIGYFAYNGCVYELLEGTFLYNMKYVSDSGIPNIEMVLVPLALFGCLIWISIREKMSRINFILIPMMALTLLLIGKRGYWHYLIILAVPSLLLFAHMIRLRWRIALGVIMLAVAAMSIRQHEYIFKSIQQHDRLKSFYAQTSRIIGNVPEEERGMIWNLNLVKSSNEDKPNIFSTLSVFINSRITPCNRVFVMFHLHTFPEDERVAANMPRWILADPTSAGYDEYAEFLQQNYTVVDATDGTCVGDVTLFKINDNVK